MMSTMMPVQTSAVAVSPACLPEYHSTATPASTPFVGGCWLASTPGARIARSSEPAGPSTRLYSSYGDVLEAYAEIISGFEAAAKEALFADTADQVFRLEGAK